MMWGMTEASPKYFRAVLGAFAWAHIWQRPDVQITVTTEPPESRFASMFGMDGTPLRVTVTHPYGRPDPRGPDRESTLITYERRDGRIRTLKSRPPASIGAVVPLGQTAIELARHALAARVRLEVELQRGYGVIHTSVPAPSMFRAERKLLPERAMTARGLGREIAEHAQMAAREVDGLRERLFA
jgi:hypothetical protein